MRKWLSVELNAAESGTFRSALKDHKIKYESSSCGYGLTHFEVYVNDAECSILNDILDTL